MRRLLVAVSAPKGKPLVALIGVVTLVVLPIALGLSLMRMWNTDFTVPLDYSAGDAVWQMTLTKMVLDSGWVLVNPFLGAPSISNWHNNPAAQTSAVHSVLMWLLGRVVRDPVAVQQVYWVLNFSLITITSFVACRMIGIARWISVCVGLLFAFTTFRFSALMYSYLANYFVIPLAIVPAVWTLVGRFARAPQSAGTTSGFLRTMLLSRRFLVCLPIMILAGSTDGYYAFFTLLTLGFAIGVRGLAGDLWRPASLVAPMALAGLLMVVVLSLMAPLRDYQRTHPEEFAPGGVVNTALIKHPHEAEIYSTSLKAMFAPTAGHPIMALRRLSVRMMETIDLNRRFPMLPWVPLGMLGSLLFVGMVGYVAVVMSRAGVWPVPPGAEARQDAAIRATLGAVASLALFVFLTAITGGIGTLIAMVYPTIRAYDRITLFLNFLLYAGGGLALTIYLRGASPRGRMLCGWVVPVVTMLAIMDQFPHGVQRRDPVPQANFLAERDFVRAVEATLLPGTMVYQYPHSQYLTNNPYYGWGSFAHMRLYMHSHGLRWSNGASRNSPVDDWHIRMAQLPIQQIAAEMSGVGFRAIVVDRGFMPAAEYAEVAAALTTLTGQPPREDAAARLSFWALPDPGYRLEYDLAYRTPVRLVVTDPLALTGPWFTSRVDAAAVAGLLASSPTLPLVIERAAHPAVFLDTVGMGRGFGAAPIVPVADMRGDVLCGPDTADPLSVSRDSLTVTIRNRSDFDWRFNTGAAPLRIGMKELLAADGSRLRWDGGFRVPGTQYVPRGGSIDVRFPLAGLDLRSGVPEGKPAVVASFALVQEGHAWFGQSLGHAECRVALVP
jgi:hypothetical protein